MGDGYPRISLAEQKAAIALETARRSCLVCRNYRAVHPTTKVSYCMDAEKIVFINSGCESWKFHKEGEYNGCQ